MGRAYEHIIRPWLFRSEPERAHDRGRALLARLSRLRFLCDRMARWNAVSSDRPVTLFGLKFPNRVGMAAGMDKDGEFPRAAAALGFGHAEIGTVTPKAQPGNPRPRLFRYPDQGVLVNRMGFNNKGAEAMARELADNYPKSKERAIPVGINIGKAKATPLDRAAEDYVACFEALAEQADYFAVNISSPNTEGLRELHAKQRLHGILSALREANLKHASRFGREPHPILVKVAPDVSFRSLDHLVEAVFEFEFAGIIATNTTVTRPRGFPSNEEGGLSGGAHLRRRSTDIVRYLYQATGGELPIIGVGGIDSPEAAGEKLDAGASLVQIYTGWVFRGPLFARDLARALTARDRHWVD